MKEEYTNNSVTYRDIVEQLGSVEQLTEILRSTDFKVTPIYGRLNNVKVLLTMATYCTEDSNVILGDAAISQHKDCADCIKEAVKGKIYESIQKFVKAVDEGSEANILSVDRDYDKLNRRVSVNEAITLYDALIAVQSAVEAKLPYID